MDAANIKHPVDGRKEEWEDIFDGTQYWSSLGSGTSAAVVLEQPLMRLCLSSLVMHNCLVVFMKFALI